MRFASIPAACAAGLATGLLPFAAVHAADGSAADSAAEAPPFSLLSIVEQTTGIKAHGYLQVGAAGNNTSKHNSATGGHTNMPVVGPADEGLQLNALTVAFEKEFQSNVLPRITPLPGPVPWEFSWGFRAELLYGRNGLPAGMLGYDAEWGINRTPEGVVPGSTRQNYWAMPQVFAQFYFPVASGVALTVGRFGSGVGFEIPPHWRPGPNFFYSHTYALVAQPDQVAGALVSANVMRNTYGLLAAEFGVVNGRQNWKDNNGDKSFIGALRWRSQDMATWVDYSFMTGNEQNRPGAAPQMPIARVISPRGQRRDHHSLSVTLHPADSWQVSAELLAGQQRGDGRADTIDILSGPGYTGGRYSGLNLHASYRASPTLQYGLRAETFHDRKGTALFPVTGVPSDFNAVTLGLRWDATKNIVIRPELRHDWQAKNNGIKAFGGGSESSQTSLAADVLIYF